MAERFDPISEFIAGGRRFIRMDEVDPNDISLRGAPWPGIEFNALGAYGDDEARSLKRNFFALLVQEHRNAVKKAGVLYGISADDIEAAPYDTSGGAAAMDRVMERLEEVSRVHADAVGIATSVAMGYEAFNRTAAEAAAVASVPQDPLAAAGMSAVVGNVELRLRGRGLLDRKAAATILRRASALHDLLGEENVADAARALASRLEADIAGITEPRTAAYAYWMMTIGSRLRPTFDPRPYKEDENGRNVGGDESYGPLAAGIAQLLNLAAGDVPASVTRDVQLYFDGPAAPGSVAQLIHPDVMRSISAGVAETRPRLSSFLQRAASATERIYKGGSDYETWWDTETVRVDLANQLEAVMVDELVDAGMGTGGLPFEHWPPLSMLHDSPFRSTVYSWRKLMWANVQALTYGVSLPVGIGKVTVAALPQFAVPPKFKMDPEERGRLATEGLRHIVPGRTLIAGERPAIPFGHLWNDPRLTLPGGPRHGAMPEFGTWLQERTGPVTEAAPEPPPRLVSPFGMAGTLGGLARSAGRRVGLPSTMPELAETMARRPEAIAPYAEMGSMLGSTALTVGLGGSLALGRVPTVLGGGAAGPVLQRVGTGINAASNAQVGLLTPDDIAMVGPFMAGGRVAGRVVPPGIARQAARHGPALFGPPAVSAVEQMMQSQAMKRLERPKEKPSGAASGKNR